MRSRYLVSVAIGDLFALAVSIVLASIYVFGTFLPWSGQPGTRVVPMLVLMGGSMILASWLTESMSPHGVPRATYGRMLSIWLITMATTALGLVFFRIYWSRRMLIGVAMLWVLFASIHRMIRRRRPWHEKLWVITKQKDLVENLERAEHARVVGVLDPATEGDIDLPERGVTLAVDLRGVLSERVAQFVSSCDVAGYTIKPFNSVYEEHVGRVPLVQLAEGWEISAPLLEVARWLPGKRIFDVTLTLVTAPLWIALGLIAALYVKIASPDGSVIFRQQRVGQGGQPFTMLKFRTMEIDAEEDGPKFAEENDSRIIRGGTFLRKSRIDEIPQLINVILGDMSLVGPRAEQVEFVRVFRRQIPFYEHRHLVRPGITGWAQVSYGYADDSVDTMEKLTYDLYYIKHMSPVFDLRVLSRSFLIVLTGWGAR